jgi:exonuclease III
VKSDMQIATWNVNSIRVRQERVLAWLAAQHPTVLCLQETKVPDDAFPRAAFEAAGYHVTAAGQQSYNGVALLSRALMFSSLTFRTALALALRTVLLFSLENSQEGDEVSLLVIR